jgi:hypothetical protein
MLKKREVKDLKKNMLKNRNVDKNLMKAKDKLV